MASPVQRYLALSVPPVPVFNTLLVSRLVRVECHTESILGGSSTRSTDMGLQDFNKVAPWHPCTFPGSRGCCRGFSLQGVYPQAPALDRRRTYCFQSSLSCNTHHPFLTLVSRVESILRVSGSRSCTGQSTEGLQENREREGFAIDRPNQNKKKTIPFSVSPPTIQVLYRRETKARLLHSTFGGEHSDLKRGLCY